MGEIGDLSPVGFSRHAKYNNSYRLATNQGTTPANKYSLPRTSTHIDLQSPRMNNNNIQSPCSNLENTGCLYVRAEPYNSVNSDIGKTVTHQLPVTENLYTCISMRHPPPQNILWVHRLF